jgi:predicted O-methyltransferase YrrM
LDRNVGFNKIKNIYYSLFGEEFNEDINMISEHLVLLSSISCNVNFDCKNILEIGSFDGKTCSILRALFPNSLITTIDLPSSDKLFQTTYQRDNQLNQFLSNRNTLLKNQNRINFIEMNSISLVDFESNQFDLIWIDGAHGYPVVAIDIINSYRLTRKGGIILIDDVWVNIKKNDPMYSSIAAYETLIALQNSKLIESFKLFYKRIGGIHNIKGEKKYVGYFKKM